MRNPHTVSRLAHRQPVNPVSEKISSPITTAAVLSGLHSDKAFVIDDQPPLVVTSGAKSENAGQVPDAAGRGRVCGALERQY